MGADFSNVKRMEYRATDDTAEGMLQLVHLVHGLTKEAIRTAWKFKTAEETNMNLSDIKATQLELKIAQIVKSFC